MAFLEHMADCWGGGGGGQKIMVCSPIAHAE